MKVRNIILSLGIACAVILVGCQSTVTGTIAVATPDADSENAAPGERTLPDESLLALGTLRLEGTANAVTPEQATRLLVYWQLIEGNTLKSAAETEAVVKQIRSQMTTEQIAAVGAMTLTGDDYQTWLQEQGIEMPAFIGGQSPSGADDMTEEERAALREQFQTMTEEERATAMADRRQPPAEGSASAPEGTMPEAEGAPGGGQRLGGAGGPMGGNVILTALIELLTERSQE